jgi:hypothetical protein
MDEFLSYRRIDGERYLYISSLSKSAVSESTAEHLGDDGFFLYECSPSGINILAKVASFEAAMTLLDLYDVGVQRAVKFGERVQARFARQTKPSSQFHSLAA